MSPLEWHRVSGRHLKKSSEGLTVLSTSLARQPVRDANKRGGTCFSARIVPIATALLMLCAALGLSQSAPRYIEGGAINVPEVTQRASLIVRGTVGNSKVRWVGRTIYTFHDLTVSESIKGSPQAKIAIATPGGAIDGVQTIWPGAPSITTGAELIFFGQRLIGRDSRGAFVAVGRFDGLVRVQSDSDTGKLVVTARGKKEDVEAFLVDVRDLSRR